MNVTSWLPLIPAVIVAALVLVLPGMAIVAAATRLRPVTVAVAPAVSIAVIGVSGVVWGVLGLRWNLLAVVVTTVLVAGIAFAIRRWLRADDAPQARASLAVWAWAAAGLVAGGVIVALQLVRGIGWPEAISQSFDVSFHLNAIEHVISSGNGSIFGLGDFTGNAYYPLGWHQLGALVVELAGVDVPSAAHAINIAIAAVAWVGGFVGLTSVVFRDRVWAPAVAAVVATGFGAFPYRLVEYGVVYPNYLAFALIPGVLGLVVLLARPDGDADDDAAVVAADADDDAEGAPAKGVWTATAGLTWVRALVLLTALVGTALAQPNGTLTTMALSLPIIVWGFGRRIVARARLGQRAAALRLAGLALAVVAASALVWQFVRPPTEDIWWGASMSAPEALKLALLGTPDIGVWFSVVSLLILVGLVALVVRPRRLWVAGPFAVATFLYVVVAAVDNVAVRQFFVGVYFTDPPRVAALVPIGAVLVCTAGAVLVVDALRWVAARLRLDRVPTVAPVGAVVLALALVHGVTLGNESLSHVLRVVRMFHAPEGRLLTAAERRVLDQVADVTEPEALIAVDPNTGAALAFALSGRAVTEPHIYSTPTEDELFLAANLRNIDGDPEVCAAVNRVGVGYVLDFGSDPVFPGNVPNDYRGFHGLVPGTHLERVLSEGPGAELYRIVGC